MMTVFSLFKRPRHDELFQKEISATKLSFPKQTSLHLSSLNFFRDINLNPTHFYIFASQITDNDNLVKQIAHNLLDWADNSPTTFPFSALSPKKYGTKVHLGWKGCPQVFDTMSL